MAEPQDAQLRPEADDSPEATQPASGERRASALEYERQGENPTKSSPTSPESSPTPAEPAATPPLGEAQQGPESEGDHEAKLEHDLEELSAKAQKADEYLELAQRTKADFENYRRRAAREASAAQERGVVKLALELLPAVDNLDRALAATDGAGESDTLASGIKLVHSDVIAALARMGIEPYWPEGERFDPQQHEAVAQQPVDGTEPGTIVEVYQRGYRLRDSVLRPARVVVAA